MYLQNTLQHTGMVKTDRVEHLCWDHPIHFHIIVSWTKQYKFNVWPKLLVSILRGRGGFLLHNNIFQNTLFLNTNTSQNISAHCFLLSRIAQWVSQWLIVSFDFSVFRAMHTWHYQQEHKINWLFDTIPDKLRNHDIEAKWLIVREWPGQHSQFLRCLKIFWAGERRAPLLHNNIFWHGNPSFGEGTAFWGNWRQCWV